MFSIAYTTALFSDKSKYLHTQDSRQQHSSKGQRQCLCSFLPSAIITITKGQQQRQKQGSLTPSYQIDRVDLIESSFWEERSANKRPKGLLNTSPTIENLSPFFPIQAGIQGLLAYHDFLVKLGFYSNKVLVQKEESAIFT